MIQKLDIVILEHAFPFPAYSGYVLQEPTIDACHSSSIKLVEELKQKLSSQLETAERKYEVKNIIYKTVSGY